MAASMALCLDVVSQRVHIHRSFTELNTSHIALLQLRPDAPEFVQKQEEPRSKTRSATAAAPADPQRPSKRLRISDVQHSPMDLHHLHNFHDCRSVVVLATHLHCCGYFLPQAALVM